ncbi:transketolase family protein [Candidatus Kaiserbacteria bacterium]|nr:transketolase family protein [Candidatus Kaiserbacteria bacterium]
MLHPDAKLREDLFEVKEQAPTRDGFGHGVVEAGRADSRIMVMCADLSESTRAEWFEKEFPDRFIEAGISEQNMAAVAAGLAAVGKVPFIASYAMFNGGRNWEQIRTVIALNEVPVVICGMHAGVSVGPDGATHQAVEDIALMRVLPHMTVLSPCDAEEARKATIAAAALGAPVYMRFGRDKTPLMTTADTPFTIGKANVLWRPDTAAPAVAIVATGPVVHNALRAARDLEGQGIAVTVTNVHTIKPLDHDALLGVAREAGAVVTVEEHQTAGGFGSAVAEMLAQEHPVPIEFIGVHDRYGQSGTPAELIEEYGMGVVHIVAAVERLLLRKR